MKFSVIATSIYEGDFLETYVQKMIEENVEDRTRLIIIPDKKTPKELYQKCRSIKKQGFNILCPTLDEQDEYLKKLGPYFTLSLTTQTAEETLGISWHTNWEMR